MRRLLLIASAALICSSTSPMLLRQVDAATTTKLAWITQDNNRFRNFDFTTTAGGSHHVDWPVDFIYMGTNASISTVQSDAYIYFPCQTQGPPPNCAHVMYMHYSTNSGSTYSWMKSATIKQSLAVCAPQQLHQRLYAPNGRFYSTQWGYYVLGTTHFDYDEGCGDWWSGKSERAEKVLCQDWVSLSVTCYYDGGDGGGSFGNAMKDVKVGHHWWMKDGHPSMALIP